MVQLLTNFLSGGGGGGGDQGGFFASWFGGGDDDAAAGGGGGAAAAGAGGASEDVAGRSFAELWSSFLDESDESNARKRQEGLSQRFNHAIERSSQL